MKVGSNDEHALDRLVGETIGDVVRFGSSRKAPNRTNTDGGCLGQVLDVSLRKLGLHCVVNLCLDWNINYYARSESLIQKFQRMRRTVIGFTRQNDDDIGRFGSINHKNFPGISCEQD